MNTKLSKKEIRHNLEAALINEIENMEGSESSKKLKRAVRKFSRNIAPKVKLDIKKNRRKGIKGHNLKNEKELSGSHIETVTENVENGRA